MPYEVKTVALKDGAQFSPEFKAINPRSKVPALIDNGHALFEAGSIIQFLCDKHAPGQWLGAPGTHERARATQWMAYIASGIHPNWTRNSRPERFGSDVDDIRGKAIATWQAEWDYVEAELAKNGPYTCGKTLQASDLYLYTVARWGAKLSPSTMDRPHVKKLCEDVAALPAVQRVLAAAGLA